MARTLYKSNLSPHTIEHPGEIKGGKVKWYGDGEMYVVMGTEDRTTYLSLNKDPSLTLTKATSSQKTALLNDALVKERIDIEKVRGIRDKYSLDQELKMARTPDSETSKAMASDIAAIVKEVDDWWDAEFNIS